MREPPIFSKGMHSAFGWMYAMEAVSHHDPTAHAKLIDEKMMDGDLRPFPTGGINLKGLTALEKFGLAAQLRQRVEEELEPYQVHVVWARYACLARGNKHCGIHGVAATLQPKMNRAKQVIADSVWHCVCTDKEREHCTLYNIGKKHSMGIMSICRDVKKIRDYLRETEDEICATLKPIFKVDNVI